jgi:hypothetical protein
MKICRVMASKPKSFALNNTMVENLDEDENSEVSSVSQQKKTNRALTKPTAQIVPMVAPKQMNTELGEKTLQNYYYQNISLI